jgi:hypothetical protein
MPKAAAQQGAPYGRGKQRRAPHARSFGRPSVSMVQRVIDPVLAVTYSV